MSTAVDEDVYVKSKISLIPKETVSLDTNTVPVQIFGKTSAPATTSPPGVVPVGPENSALLVHQNLPVYMTPSKLFTKAYAEQKANESKRLDIHLSKPNIAVMEGDNVVDEMVNLDSMDPAGTVPAIPQEAGRMVKCARQVMLDANGEPRGTPLRFGTVFASLSSPTRGTSSANTEAKESNPQEVNTNNQTGTSNEAAFSYSANNPGENAYNEPSPEMGQEITTLHEQMQSKRAELQEYLKEGVKLEEQIEVLIGENSKINERKEYYKKHYKLVKEELLNYESQLKKLDKEVEVSMGRLMASQEQQRMMILSLKETLNKPESPEKSEQAAKLLDAIIESLAQAQPTVEEHKLLQQYYLHAEQRLMHLGSENAALKSQLVQFKEAEITMASRDDSSDSQIAEQRAKNQLREEVSQLRQQVATLEKEKQQMMESVIVDIEMGSTKPVARTSGQVARPNSLRSDIGKRMAEAFDDAIAKSNQKSIYADVVADEANRQKRSFYTKASIEAGRVVEGDWRVVGKKKQPTYSEMAALAATKKAVIKTQDARQKTLMSAEQLEAFFLQPARSTASRQGIVYATLFFKGFPKVEYGRARNVIVSMGATPDLIEDVSFVRSDTIALVVRADNVRTAKATMAKSQRLVELPNFNPLEQMKDGVQDERQAKLRCRSRLEAAMRYAASMKKLSLFTYFKEQISAIDADSQVMAALLRPHGEVKMEIENTGTGGSSAVSTHPAN